jgi:segregation and condensation protein B
VSRPEVDAIRGVNSEGVLDSLMERRLVRIAGRKEAPGRPFLYETTREFLVAFGLRDLADLPKVDGELIVPDLGSGDAGATGAEDAATGVEGALASAAGNGHPPETDDASEGHAEATAEGTVTVDGDAPTEQDPGAGGPDVTARG